MKDFITTVLLTLAVLCIPSFAIAQTPAEILISEILYIITLAIPVLLGLAVLLFLWGLAQYVTKTGDVESREGAKQKMIWGIVAIFVMVSIWGLVAFLQTVFGVNTIVNPDWPQFE